MRVSHTLWRDTDTAVLKPCVVLQGGKLTTDCVDVLNTPASFGDESIQLPLYTDGPVLFNPRLAIPLNAQVDLMMKRIDIASC